MAVAVTGGTKTATHRYPAFTVREGKGIQPDGFRYIEAASNKDALAFALANGEPAMQMGHMQASRGYAKWVNCPAPK